MQRDYFYDPGMHGVDWEAMKQRYGALLGYLASRDDLNYIIGEMIAELNASHTYVSGGDIESPPRLNVGLLGCDFELDVEHNAYRIAKIYEGTGGTPSRARRCGPRASMSTKATTCWRSTAGRWIRRRTRGPPSRAWPGRP